MKGLARGFRLMGRILLAMEAIALAGGVAWQIFGLFGGGEQSATIQPVEISGDGSGAAVFGVRTSDVIWSVLLVTAFVICLVITIRQFNGWMRRTIDKIAKFVHMDILATELGLTGLVGVLVCLLLLFYLPVGAILAAVFCLTAEMCFVLAWLFYGRKKYKI